VAWYTLESLLRRMQRSCGYRAFGQCADCRHLHYESGIRYRCGLTREELGRDNATKISFEHKPPVES